MFGKMRLATKVFSGFIAIALIACVIGVFGIYEIKQIERADTMMYENVVVPLDQVASIAVNFQRMRINTRDLHDAGTKEERANFEKRLKDLRSENAKVVEAYEKTIVTDEGRKLFGEFQKSREAYGADLDKFVELIRQGKNKDAADLLKGDMNKSSRVEQDIIDKLTDQKTAMGKKTTADNSRLAATATYLMIGFTVIGILLALILGFIVSGIIKNIISTLLAETKNLVDASIAGKLATRGNVEKVNFEFQGIVQGVNETLDAVIGPLNVAAEYVDRISKGDIPPKITDSYSGDFNEIKNNLNQCIDAVNTLVGDASVLSMAAIEGKLATRADATKHQGDFRKIVGGVNDTLDAVIGPLNVAAEYVDRISKGDIPPRITDSYNGDFNEIKNNLNQCIDAVNTLVTDTNILSKAAVEGKLATRADASKHQGDFRKIVAGVNDTLDAVIGPLNVTAEYVDRISKGDIPPRITDNYNGDFNEIKNNLNQLIDVANKLLEEADILVEASKEGKLDTRGNADRFAGGWRDLYKGINNILDAILIPIGEGNRILAQVSNGKIDELISQTYKGDHEKMKQAINNVAVVLQGLQKELGRLTEASRAGQLSERGKPEQFKGAYAEVISGMNTMLDAILIPIGEGNRILAQVSNGKIDELISQTYKGDHEKMKQAINNVAVVLQGLHKELGRLTEASREGQLSERGKVDQFQGAYAEVVRGVNTTLDALIAPLNVTAEYVDRISKGDIPPKITDIYKGDFNEIKNNLNQCIDAVNALVVDANVLSKAAVEGKLSTRADATKHHGDFRKIINGVNETLDAVIGPLNVAAEYVDRISKGDIPPKITDSYNGDFNEIKNNLNVLIEAMNEITGVAEQISTGNLTVQVRERSAQDKLMQALSTMLERLMEVVANVQASTEQVSTSSQEMSVKTEQISQGATEQAASAEEVSSSMEQMNSNIMQNADNAQQTEKIAVKAAEDAREGGKSVSETVDAMKEIASKISIIEEIARQTNMLALNAAIEAARAGEHGKGFAVVAAEVRRLAERSQTAAGEINRLSASSVLISERAGEMLGRIVPAIQKTADLVQEITAASSEQKNGADQINKAIQQLDQVIQQNAAASEEMATTAEGMNTQSEQLRSAIAFFKTENGGLRGEHPQGIPARRVAKAAPKMLLHPVSEKFTGTVGKIGHPADKRPGCAIDLSEGRGMKDEKDSEFEKY